MRRLALVLALSLVAGGLEAQPVRAAPSWLRLYVMRPQFLPGSPFGGGSGGGAVYPVSDATFAVSDDGDPTKIWKVQASGITTGNTVTPLAFGGTTAASTVTVSGSTTFAPGGTTVAAIENSAGFGIVIADIKRLAWGSSGVATPDLFLVRSAAATLQQGVNINGAPTTQILKAANGVTGTDVIGSGLTIESGIGTGAGVSQPYTVNRQIVKATGTTAQTYAPAVIVCPSKILSNTSATTTTIATVTTTTASAGMVSWTYSVIASNGSLVDIDGGTLNVAWNNAAGTAATTAGTAVSTANSVGSGSHVALPTATVATNVVSLKVTPTWTVIVPTLVTGIATFTVHSLADTVACQ